MGTKSIRCFFLAVLVLLLGTGGMGMLWAAPGHPDSEHTPHNHESGGQVQETKKDTEPTSAALEEKSETSGQKTAGQYADGLDRVLPGLAGAPNIHPMLVHFPIAFIVASTVFFVLSWFTYPEHFLMIGRWMFWLGLISLPVVVASGFWAVGGWGEGHVTGHRNWMVLTTITAFLVFAVARFVSNRKRLYRVVLTVGLIIVTLFMTIGADRGAWLVFVEGAGVQPVQHEHNH